MSEQWLRCVHFAVCHPGVSALCAGPSLPGVKHGLMSHVWGVSRPGWSGGSNGGVFSNQKFGPRAHP